MATNEAYVWSNKIHPDDIDQKGDDYGFVTIKPTTTDAYPSKFTIKDQLDSDDIKDGSLKPVDLNTEEDDGGELCTLNILTADGDHFTVNTDTRVGEPSIDDGAVSTPKIRDNAVTEPKLADGAASTRVIADLAVTSDKIGTHAVNADKIADNAVVTRTIRDGNVTEPKLADNSVSNRTIVAEAVTGDKIAPESILPPHLKFGETKSGENLSTLTLLEAEGETEFENHTDIKVDTDSLNDKSVTSDKLADAVNSRITNAVSTANDAKTLAESIAGRLGNVVGILAGDTQIMESVSPNSFTTGTVTIIDILQTYYPLGLTANAHWFISMEYGSPDNITFWGGGKGNSGYIYHIINNSNYAVADIVLHWVVVYTE